MAIKTLIASLIGDSALRAQNSAVATTALSVESNAPHWLKFMVARSDRPELEQAALRVGISAVVLIYLIWYAFRQAIEAAQTHLEVLVVAFAFFLFSCLLVVRILGVGKPSVRRRFLGMVIDNAVTTYCLIRMGEGGAVIIAVYLFISFGNGFRYGRLYLHVCQVMALVGFALVLTYGDYWSHSIYVGIGYLIALLVLPFYVGVLAHRITDARKRADVANEAKGRFLATVSHEMRTPLNGVIAMSDVLRETSLNESQREIVDTLGTSAQLLLAQIEDVLDMAKIEAGRVQIERQPFDLGRVLTSSVKVVVPQARYKGLAVNTEISPETLGWFKGDSHHLRQVLLNLLANAVKFTERGSVCLKVRAVGGSTAETKVRFEVQDTGIGIDPAKQAAIFEPFTQADDSITRVYGGTGLGTAIAKNLVALMGGEIGVTSELGVGSIFWFELPLARTEPLGIDLRDEFADTERLSTAAAALAAEQKTKVTKIRGARILVAEDNPTNQRVTQLILESGGHHVTIVSDGEAALDALERLSFDLALFDLSMPIVSGLEALKLYRFTTSSPIPILVLSANVTSQIISECQGAGCAEFLPKPIRPTVLLDAVERHISEIVPAARSSPPPREERPALTVIDTPPIDKQVLADLGRLSTDPTFVDRLLRGFQSDTERLINCIVNGLGTRKYEDVRDAAHALKGGAGSVGATQLVQLAIRFEKATHETLRIRAAAWIEELTRAASTANAAFDRHLEERKQSSQS